jgi:hypothetical protein
VVTVDVNIKQWHEHHEWIVCMALNIRALGPDLTVWVKQPIQTETPSGSPEVEDVSAYPTLDDLPRDGWVWYDEREGTDPITDTERASNA